MTLTMKEKVTFLITLWFISASTSTSTSTTVAAYHIPATGRSVNGGKNKLLSNDRRGVLATVASSVSALVITTTFPTESVAATASVADSISGSGSGSIDTNTNSNVNVYYGVGCFWHIQHEFIQAERDLLHRTKDIEITSRTGYAGGKKTGEEGKVCYHNYYNTADYGKLGHGEVVGMNIPTSTIEDFTKVYFDLYSSETGERVDPGDKGGEYRSLIGLPGGVSHPEYPKVEAAASASGKKLVAGKGNEPDTFGKGIVYVYDTKIFPFHQGEVYHQFHNDPQSPAYGKAYNDLADILLEAGRIELTECPDRV